MSSNSADPGTRRPAVFLDRDGTVIREIDYLADPDLVELIPGAGEAIRRLNQLGFAVVIVTNQSGIARGMLDETILAEIHRVMLSQLEVHDARIDHIEYCAHHPKYDGVETPRRKPGPGMLLDAAEALDLDLNRSWMIGDALRDIEAGHAAGSRSILVETGKGAQERERITPGPSTPAHVAADIGSAIDWLLAQGK